MTTTRIAVIGAGAWGTALATVLTRPGQEAVLWAREAEVVAAINERHENKPFLPDVALDPAIRATGDMGAALESAEVVLLVAPAQFVRPIAETMRPHIPAEAPLVLCAKGIEQGSCKLMSEILSETLPNQNLAVLSGPTFAREVARGLPAAVTLAAAEISLADHLVELIGTPLFRPYRSDDVIGAQIGGAVKNVIAIACGIVAGRQLGDNARAALITRGLAEMVRLGLAKGGRAETMMGLSGLGDLTLTCNAMQSRNMSLGAALGQGRRLEDVLGERRSVAEGVHSARSVHALAVRLGVDMPITAAVDAILHEGAAIDEIMEALLSRPFRSEACSG